MISNLRNEARATTMENHGFRACLHVPFAPSYYHVWDKNSNTEVVTFARIDGLDEKIETKFHSMHGLSGSVKNCMGSLCVHS